MYQIGTILNNVTGYSGDQSDPDAAYDNWQHNRDWEVDLEHSPQNRVLHRTGERTNHVDTKTGDRNLPVPTQGRLPGIPAQHFPYHRVQDQEETILGAPDQGLAVSNQEN